MSEKTEGTAPAVEKSSSGPAVEKSSSGIDANLAALLTYLIGPLSGVYFFATEKDSKFVRFHAMQSILLGIVSVVVLVVLQAVIGSMFMFVRGGWRIAGMLNMLLSLGVFMAWVYCMVKAYRHELFKIPVIGDIAEKQAQKQA